MSNTQLLAILIGGCIGLALSVPVVWAVLTFCERRDRDRVNRAMRRYEKRNGNR
jgi:hypothetical protein